MPFAELAPIAVAAKSLPAVSISSTNGRNGVHPRMSIFIRPWLIESCPSWLRADNFIRVALGVEQHEGLLRLMANGGHQLRLMKIGRAGSEPKALYVVLPGAKRAAEYKPVAVEFDYSDEWLEITLPKMQAPAAIAAPAVTGAMGPIVKASTSCKSKGFSMLGGTVRK